MVGHLELVIGPMFASKTHTLIQRYGNLKSIGIEPLVLTHELDTRSGTSGLLWTHDGRSLPAHPCTRLMSWLDDQRYKTCGAILIEEAQFFDDLSEFVDIATDRDSKQVVVCGLSGDFLRRPFPSIAALIGKAERITHLSAMCQVCRDGTLAAYSQRTNSLTSTIAVGGQNEYRPVCRKHFG